MAEAMTRKATAKAKAKAKAKGKAAGSRDEAARPAVTGIEKPNGHSHNNSKGTAGRDPSVVYSPRMTSLLFRRLGEGKVKGKLERERGGKGWRSSRWLRHAGKWGKWKAK